jgi:hypothetical protein
MERNDKNCTASQNLPSHRQPRENYRRHDRLSDTLVDYLRNARPTVVGGVDNNPVIIPPLNTDIRFDNYLPTPTTSQYTSYRLN